MKFSITNRKLMKMLFELGTVKEMSGTYEDGFVVRRWDVICKPDFWVKDKVWFDVLITGYYDRIGGATLDEALDALEAKMEELAA